MSPSAAQVSAAYLAEQGLAENVSCALSQLMFEKPDNGLERLAEILFEVAEQRDAKRRILRSSLAAKTTAQHPNPSAAEWVIQEPEMRRESTGAVDAVADAPGAEVRPDMAVEPDEHSTQISDEQTGDDDDEVDNAGMETKPGSRRWSLRLYSPRSPSIHNAMGPHVPSSLSHIPQYSSLSLLPPQFGDAQGRSLLAWQTERRDAWQCGSPSRAAGSRPDAQPEL